MLAKDVQKNEQNFYVKCSRFQVLGILFSSYCL